MPKLELSNKTHKNSYEKLIKEWSEAEQIPTSPWLLFSKNDYEELLYFIENDPKY
jgi:hypothetical protein